MKYLRDKTKKDAYMCQSILNMFQRGELRKDHPQQRKADNWDNCIRDGFTASIIKQEDVNPVVICEQLTENGVVLWLIDGLQRLTNLEKFRRGLFKLGKNVEYPIIEYQTVLVDENGVIVKDEDGAFVYQNLSFDIRGKGYKDLPEKLRENFDNCMIDIVKHLDCTDGEVGYHIRRYNHQRSMNICQKSITYMDSTAKYVKDISDNHQFFKNHGHYTLNEKKNGTLDRIVIESMMSIFFLDKWQKQSKSVAKYINSNTTKKDFDYLSGLLDRLSAIMVDELSKYFNAKNSFILITLFSRFTKLNIPDKYFADFMGRFDYYYTKPVDGETFYEFDTARSSKEKKVVTKKITILETLLHEFLLEQIPGFNAEYNIKYGSVQTEHNYLINFIKDVLDITVTKEDVLLYSDVVTDLIKKYAPTSKLLDIENRPSLVALICYAFNLDIVVDNWFSHYIFQHDTYLSDQKENYKIMVDDLINYTNSNNDKIKIEL